MVQNNIQNANNNQPTKITRQIFDSDDKHAQAYLPWLYTKHRQ